METIHDFKHFSFSTQMAVIFFVFGTLIFGMYFLMPQYEGIFILGLCYVLFAGFCSSVLLIRLFYLLLVVPPSDRESIIIRMLIVLANIPVAIFYLYLIIHNIKSTSLL